MNNILRIIVFIFFGSLFGYSQFNYQSILKNDNGEIIKDTSVNFRISIAYDSPTATPVYSELHNISISTDGVINILIGNGSALTGNYSDVDWSKNIYIKREVALSGGSSNFTDFGATRLNSIPKATYSENSKGLSFTSSNTIQLGDGNITLVNTSGTISATSFTGLGNDLLINSSNTTSSLLTIIEDLEAKINALTSSVESATLKTYNGRNFQSNIVTQTSIFTVSYNEIYEQPNWIEYSVRDVTASISRSGDFYGVDGIYTSNEDDYHDNHWDKGHLAPAAAFLDSQENLEATFSYLNCVLMKDNLNRYEWAQLESQIRTWANDLGVDIDVRVDMFFDDGHEVLDTGAHVPSRFLKTITLPSGYSFPNETISKKCFEFPNTNTNGADWTSFEITCN